MSGDCRETAGVSGGRKQKKRKGVILTCKAHLTGFYESHEFQNFGIAESEHGGAVWYDMRREL